MKGILQKYLFVFIALPFSAACIAMTFFLSKPLALTETVILFALCFTFILITYVKEVHIVSQIKSAASQLGLESGTSLKSIPFLCVAFDESGNIFWCNDSFSRDFFPSGRTKTSDICEILNFENVFELVKESRVIKADNLRQYTTYPSHYSDKDEKTNYILFLVDDTELKLTEEKYFATRPSVLLVSVDTTDEIYQNFKDSECGAILGRIEEIVDSWAGKFNSLCRKLSAGRYIIIAEEKNLSAMINDKFKVLEYVRNLSYADKKINATLSIGIGKSEDLLEANDSAKTALDMAQSRGGDQVAIKTGKDYSFFGGVSVGFERSNKIKARVVATSLVQLIEGCENVIIMGHRFTDLDAFGASMGMFMIAKELKKPVNIVIDKANTLAMPLITKFEKAGYADSLVSVDKSKYMVNQNTLLVVVDTHKPDFTECPELLSKTKKIVVIDHHRKSVDHIDNAVLFFHTSYASSASEMVTELAQYISDKSLIDPLTAQALLAGIMLDTRNFVLRTGVRTFEAAAYLRSRGADTVEVKKLFSTDLEINKYRNQIVDSASEYESCAISVADPFIPNIRLITSQAADELLNVDGVKGSFVIFKIDDTVCISARSFGEMNVQVIMEKFGGGGHRTMAAAQIPNSQTDDILKKLKDEIKSYFENL